MLDVTTRGVNSARTLIATTELPPIEAFAADAVGGTELPTFDPDKDQNLVIGSDVVSFTTGVDADFRQAITDSALFAQLAALHQVGPSADPMDFFDAYFAILLGLGWIEQSHDTATLDTSNTGLDVHKAVIGVITEFLAPIAGAAQAVIAVLNGLYQMDSSAPFITLFNQRSAHEKIGQFQFTYVQNEPGQGLIAKIAAFGLVAKDDVTQILFFKFGKQVTSLRRSRGSLSIDPEALKALKPNLAAKVMAYRAGLIAEADLGQVGS
jgi:hypothetical protein